MNDTNFIGESAQRYAEAINEQVAIAITTEIDRMIDLDSVIAEDLENRKTAFQEAYDSTEDEELRAAMKEPTIEFPNITSKLEYAFKALLSKWFTFTHDINWAWVVSIKFFKIEKEVKYYIDAKYSVNIDEKDS